MTTKNLQTFYIGESWKPLDQIKDFTPQLYLPI